MCAGSSEYRRVEGAVVRDHPRVRGEQWGADISTSTGGGSPPRARGAAGRLHVEVEREGITPACAGSSPGSSGRPSRPPDHPRVRGEQFDGWQAFRASMGSPPRARGAGPAAGHRVDVAGITPACAGSSGRRCGQQRGLRDHPRVRGEQLKQEFGERLAEGSPPRARGAAARVVAGVAVRGITPACAGSRPPAPALACGDGDHPRVRGEQPVQFRRCVALEGSPPRARGADRLPLRRPLQQGITPACAGSRKPEVPDAHRCWDHPRVRGEQASDEREFVRNLGSPPRARGAGHCLLSSPMRARITPACAGSSHQ